MRIKLGTPLRLNVIPKAAKGVCATTIPHLQVVEYLTTSSKEVEKGDLFVALKGEHADGNDWIEDAIKNGASAILYSKEYKSAQNTAYMIRVEDTLHGLENLAKYYSRLFPHKTIAVTGSVGKTTTRHYIACLLGAHYKVHEAPLNYNNLLGVSLSILSAPLDTEYLVLEVGMDGRGQISRISHLIQPDIAVITNIGISHIEKLNSQEEICLAKLEILHGMEDGKLFIHGDDPYLLRYAPPGAVTVSCTNQTSLCYATNIELTAHGTTFDFTSPVGTWRKVYINTIGEHTLSCALFGIAVAQAVSVPHDVICLNLLAYEPIYQRQSILHLGEVTIILDAYNACPASMKAALQTAHLLAQETGGNMVACLGDMLELGRNSCVYHEEIGRACAKVGVTHLFTIGNYASFYQNGAISAGLSSQQVTALNNLPTPMQVATILPSLKPKSILLLKGSRKNRLENLLPYLKSSLS